MAPFARLGDQCPRRHTIDEDDVRAMAGRRADEVVQHWIDRHGWEDDIKPALMDDVHQTVIGHIEEQGQALPGVYELLDLLQAHDIPMAVASSSTPEVIEAVLEKLHMKGYMRLSHSAIHEPKGKPDPAVFITTAKQLGVSPSECLVFEDSISGVQAAKAAGMKCIAVPEPVNRQRSEYHIADITIDSLVDVDWSMIQKL